MPQTQPPPFLSVQNICKSFGENEILKDIQMDIHSGRVHALIGENGAGKSTLVKIIGGYQPATSGDILLNQKSITFSNSKQAEEQGIILIHQETNLADDLTVEENVFLGQERRKGLFLDKKQMRQATIEALDKLHVKIDPNIKVKSLSTSDKQMVEIAKAITHQTKLLIMDEPTSMLTETEAEILFELIKRLTEQGTAILYISHKLNEIEKIADDISILRDGNIVYNGLKSAVTKYDIANMMIGRDVSQMYPEKHPIQDENDIIFEVKSLKGQSMKSPVSFTVRKGEVLGFGGIIGSGRTAVLETMLGLKGRYQGDIYLNGQKVKIAQFSDAIALGISYLTEDRKGKGLLLNMGMTPNITLLNIQDYCTPLLNHKQEQQATQKAIEEYHIKLRTNIQKVGELSGGNQQKLLLAKVMSITPDLIVMNEPTRGIDIGTKQEIYKFIKNLTEQGKSVILISSELTELIALSHRVLVMYDGHMSGIVKGNDISEENIMHYAAGIKGETVNA